MRMRGVNDPRRNFFLARAQLPAAKVAYCQILQAHETLINDVLQRLSLAYMPELRFSTNCYFSEISEIPE